MIPDHAPIPNNMIKDVHPGHRLCICGVYFEDGAFDEHVQEREENKKLSTLLIDLEKHVKYYETHDTPDSYYRRNPVDACFKIHWKAAKALLRHIEILRENR